jgi:hypothetical protein
MRLASSVWEGERIRLVNVGLFSCHMVDRKGKGYPLPEGEIYRGLAEVPGVARGNLILHV